VSPDLAQLRARIIVARRYQDYLRYSTLEHEYAQRCDDLGALGAGRRAIDARHAAETAAWIACGRFPGAA
jgi:hypothetical protein